jgi:lipopolysaccharide export LptBFGC system permease protein LptF
MNANDARQAARKRDRKRRSFEQSSHRAFSEKMKKHVKRISNEESTQNLRDVNEKYHVKKNETAQKLNQIEKLFRYSYENETYRAD